MIMAIYDLMSQKLARNLFITPILPIDWGKFIWMNFIPPAKTLVLWKLLHNKMPSNSVQTCVYVFDVYFM